MPEGGIDHPQIDRDGDDAHIALTVGACERGLVCLDEWALPDRQDADRGR